MPFASIYLRRVGVLAFICRGFTIHVVVVAVLLLCPASKGAKAQLAPNASCNVSPVTHLDTIVLSQRVVEQLVLSKSPAFLAQLQNVAIARGELRQLSTPNISPELSFIAPGAGAGATSMRNPMELTLTQSIDWMGRRTANRDAANAAVRSSSQLAQDDARERVEQATRTLLALEAAGQRLNVVRESAELGRRLMDAVQQQFLEGEISALEANLAGIEAGRIRARVTSEQRACVEISAGLKQLLGVNSAIDIPARMSDSISVDGIQLITDGSDSLVLNTHQFNVDSLIKVAVKQRASLKAIDAMIDEARSQQKVAVRTGRPDISAGIVVERIPGEASSRVGPAIGMTVPLWNRNQGTRDAWRARERQLQLLRNAELLNVQAEVTAASSTLLLAIEEVQIHAREVLQPARKNSLLLETAYRAGKIPLPTLLLLRNQLLDAELSYWDAWLVKEQAIVGLRSAIGTLLTTNTSHSNAEIGK